MTRQTTIASKNSSQGLSQQLSNLQIRRALKIKTLFNERMCNKRNSTQKIVVKLLRQLVTECSTDRVPATALYTYFSNCLQSVVSLVHSTTGYRVYRLGTGYTALYSCFNNYRLHSLVQLLQQLVIECIDQVPATQPCIVGSTTTGYTALYSYFNNWL